jgi:hypothetical protein
MMMGQQGMATGNPQMGGFQQHQQMQAPGGFGAFPASSGAAQPARKLGANPAPVRSHKRFCALVSCVFLAGCLTKQGRRIR